MDSNEIRYDNQKIKDVEISDEIRKAFLDYSMSVIVQRALPDVRDGLKPVHRRILYAMYDNNLYPTNPYRKCATTVGEVLGHYHPHGDASVYDAMVRLAQTFSMRHILVDGHGNQHDGIVHAYQHAAGGLAGDFTGFELDGVTTVLEGLAEFVEH